MDVLDHLLADLRKPTIDHALDQLEAGVWDRIEADRRASSRGLRAQLAVAVTGMVIGITFGSVSALTTAATEGQLAAAGAASWGALQIWL